MLLCINCSQRNSSPLASCTGSYARAPAVLSKTPLGDLMVRAGLNGFLSLSSRWIEQQEDDKQAEMMDERGRKIFQSICHPQFPSHQQETGLMSWSIQAGFCHW